MGIDVKTHGDDLFSAAAYDASPARARSEAQERASVLIAGRTLSVGNVLASENARKLLGVRGTPTGVTAKVEIDSAALSFQDIALERNKS